MTILINGLDFQFVHNSQLCFIRFNIHSNCGSKSSKNSQKESQDTQTQKYSVQVSNDICPQMTVGTRSSSLSHIMARTTELSKLRFSLSLCNCCCCYAATQTAVHSFEFSKEFEECSYLPGQLRSLSHFRSASFKKI